MSSSTNPSPTSAMQFQFLKAPSTIGPRLGRLTTKSRQTIETPHYVGITSRGVVPHLSQDMMQKHTALRGVYVPLEDFIERASLKQTPPVLSQNAQGHGSALRNFIALPEDQLLILGARRTPPVISPWANTRTSVSISTAFGFGQIESEDYVDAVTILKPDIVVALGDIPYGQKAGSRRIERMGLRTERWLNDLLHPDTETEDGGSHELAGKIFAPILPIMRQQQSLYLEFLGGTMREKISGLAIYDADTVPELDGSLTSLPMLSLTNPKSPAEILREISLGLDIFTAPFLTRATDAGIALAFRFPAIGDDSSGNPPKPLGYDMWLPEHAADLSPLAAGCDCYACSVHHRAYVRHLLSAKEMLAWVLLQIHNIRIMDAFFAGVRTSIEQGTFENDRERFSKVYETYIPQNTEQGPRVRGYQIKSEGPSEAKKNVKAYNTLDDIKERNVVPDPENKGDDLHN